MTERGGWIAVGLSRDVPAGTRRGVIVEGREVVLWRDGNGAIHGWEDRCPHRGMRLSFGFVRANALNCLYHGWRYGSSAICEAIPAHPDLVVPPTIRANAYWVHEERGLIWLSFEARIDAPPAPPAGAAPVASVTVLADGSAVAARFGASPLIECATANGQIYLARHSPGPGRTVMHAIAAAEDRVAAAWEWLKATRDAIEGAAAE